MLMGNHVCDTGHWNDIGNPGCWNEIHPVVAITKLPPDVGRGEPPDPTRTSPRRTHPGNLNPKDFHNCYDYANAVREFVSSTYRGPSISYGKSVPLEHDSIG